MSANYTVRGGKAWSWTLKCRCIFNLRQSLRIKGELRNLFRWVAVLVWNNWTKFESSGTTNSGYKAFMCMNTSSDGVHAHGSLYSEIYRFFHVPASLAILPCLARHCRHFGRRQTWQGVGGMADKQVSYKYFSIITPSLSVMQSWACSDILGSMQTFTYNT